MTVLVACAVVLALPPGGARKPTISLTMGLLLAVGALTAARGAYRVFRAPRAATPIRLDDPRAGRRTGLGYKSFVAWRYLLVSRPHVTRRTKLLLLAGMVFLAVIGLGLQIGDAGPAAHVSPLWSAQIVALAFIAGVVVIGVLRFSKPAWISSAIGLGVLIIAWIALAIWGPDLHHPMEMMSENRQRLLIGLFWARNVGAGIAGLAMFFGSL